MTGPAEPGPRIVRCGPSHVEDVIRFLAAAYALDPLTAPLYEGERARARWDWLNVAVPDAPAEGLPAWLALAGQRIVGHIGMIPAQAVVRGRPVPVAWARDLIVAPETRGLGIGSRLMATVIDHTERCLILGEYDDAVRLYRRLGYADRGLLPIHVKVGRPGRLLATLRAPAVVRAMATVGLAALRTRPPIASGPGIVKRLAAFDGRFDDWWRAVEPAFGCVIRRSSATMNWRYRDVTRHRYSILELSIDGAIRGYAVVRPGLIRGAPAVMLTEILAHPADRASMHGLIRAAEVEMDALQPALFRSAVLHPAFGAALRRCGYVPVPSGVRFMVAEHGSEHDPLPPLRAWYLNGGDSDIDFL